MKLYLLKLLATRWSKYKYISYVKRIFDNELLICFDKKYLYQIDLNKAKSFVYLVDNEIKSKKTTSYQAPFDNMLHFRFHSSDILSVKTFDNDRVLQIFIQKKLPYKVIQTSLQLEFTGRNTNAIILDEQNIIIEALRHIDDSLTYRAIKAGIVLQPLKPYKIQEKPQEISDIDEFLSQSFKSMSDNKINTLKTKALLKIDNKITKANNVLVSLGKKEDIQNTTTLWSKKANLILANAKDIDIYKSSVVLEGITIDIPSNLNSVYQLSEYCFKKSKKSKAIEKNIYIQTQNIEQKLLFLKRHKSLIQDCYDLDKLIFTSAKVKKSNKITFCEEFVFRGFKIMVGRNSSENAKILQNSKKDDLWMHIKDTPSSHVVVVSKKQQIPMDVIQKAANLCVDVSVSSNGKYIVDYTYRRYVRIQKGSNVLYVNHKSIFVHKDSTS